MAGFAVTKCFGEDSDQPYDTTGHWEPKPAFQTIAQHFT
jgi:hypothetical protein